MSVNKKDIDLDKAFDKAFKTVDKPTVPAKKEQKIDDIFDRAFDVKKKDTESTPPSNVPPVGAVPGTTSTTKPKPDNVFIDVDGNKIEVRNGVEVAVGQPTEAEKKILHKETLAEFKARKVQPVKWDDNPLNPVKAVNDSVKAANDSYKEPAPEKPYFKDTDDIKIKELSQKYNAPAASDVEVVAANDAINPILRQYKSVQKNPIAVAIANSNNIEATIKEKIAGIDQNAKSEKGTYYSPAMRKEKEDLEKDLTEVDLLRKKAVTLATPSGDKEIEAIVRVTPTSNTFEKFVAAVVGGEPGKIASEAIKPTDTKTKLSPQFVTGLNSLKYTEPVEWERLNEAIKSGRPISDSQVGKIEALGAQIDAAKLLLQVDKMKIATAPEQDKLNQYSNQLTKLKTDLDEYEATVKSGMKLSSSQIADYKSKVAQYNSLVVEVKPIQEKLAAINDVFSKKAEALQKVSEGALLNRPEILQAFFAENIGDYLDDLGKAAQATSPILNPGLVVANYFTGNTWNYSDEEIAGAAKVIAKREGIDINDPRVQSVVKKLQENEGWPVGMNSISKGGGGREFFGGVVKNIVGTVKGLERVLGLGKSLDDLYIESQSEGNLNIAQKRLKSEDQGVRGVVNTVVAGAGEFGAQAALMYGVSGIAGGIGRGFLGRAGVAAVGGDIALADMGVKNIIGKSLLKFKDPIGVYTTSFAMGYEPGLKQALSYTADNELASRFGALSGHVEALTELVLSPLEIARGIVRKFTGKETTSLLKILSDKSLKNDPGKFKDFFTKFYKGIIGTGYVAAAEIGEELVSQTWDYYQNQYLNPNSKSFQDRSLWKESLETAYQTGLTMAIPALLNGIGATQANTYSKGALLVAAQNRQKIVDGLKQDLFDKKIDQQTFDTKVQLVNTAFDAHNQLPKKIDGSDLNTDEKANYVWSRVTEAYMDKKMGSLNDAAAKEIWKDKILKQQEYRKKILGLSEMDPEVPEYTIDGKPVGREEFLRTIEEKPDGNYVVTGDEEAQEALRKIGGVDDKTDSEVTTAVIEIGGKMYEGKNHAEAILKAKADGQDISNVDRKAQGKFKLSDGTIISREQAKKQFGADRAEQLIEQDEAADNANKEYRKSDKDLVNEVKEKNVKNYENPGIEELKKQALEAPDSFKNQFGDEELTVDLIAKNSEQQIKDAIAYQQERLTNDPNMDEVSMEGIDRHIKLLELGLERNKEFAEAEKEAQDKTELNKKREKYGLEPLRPTYRGTSQEEWESVQNGQPFKSKTGFGDNEANTTWVSDKKEYSDEYVKSNENGLLVEFKPEAIDKSGVESGQQGDDTGVRLGRNLRLEDVQRVTDKNGKVIYEAPKESKKKVEPAVSEQGQPLSKLQQGAAKALIAKEKEVPGETLDDKLRYISEQPEGTFGKKLTTIANERFPKKDTPPTEQQSGKDAVVDEGSGGVGEDVEEPKSYAEATDAYKATELGGSEDAKNKKQALVEQAETEEGKKFVESEVSKLEKNDDGTITVFRSGTLQEGHNPATTSRKTAEIIAAERKKQGLSSDIVEVKVNPSDISVVVKGIESEVFVKVDKSNKERIDKNTVQKQKTKAELLTERDEVQKELEKTKKALDDSERAFNDGTYPFSENVFKDANKKQKAKIKNLEWQLSKIEQSLKETTKAETIPTISNQSEIEAKKADIERRRQEELTELGQKQLTKGFNSLSEATKPEQVANAIVNIEQNKNQGALLSKEQEQTLSEARAKLKEQGYEIVDYNIVKYGENTIVQAVDFYDNEKDVLTEEQANAIELKINTLEKRGEEVNVDDLPLPVSRTIKPLIKKDGKMVQAAEVNTLIFKSVEQAREAIKKSREAGNKKPNAADKINAKYDAELKAVEQSLSTKPNQKTGEVDEGVGTRLRTEDEIKRIKQRNQKLIDNNNKIVELTGKDNAGEALDALGELYRSKVDEANANAKIRYKEGMSIDEKNKIVDEEFEKSGVGEIDKLINHLNDTNDTNSFKTTSLSQEVKDIQKESDEAHTKKVKLKASEQSLSTPKAEPQQSGKDVVVDEGVVYKDTFENREKIEEGLKEFGDDVFYHGSSDISYLSSVGDISTENNTKNAESKYVNLTPKSGTAVSYSIRQQKIGDKSGVAAFKLNGKKYVMKDSDIKSLKTNADYEAFYDKKKSEGYDYVEVPQDAKNIVVLNNSAIELVGKKFNRDSLSTIDKGAENQSGNEKSTIGSTKEQSLSTKPAVKPDVVSEVDFTNKNKKNEPIKKQQFSSKETGGSSTKSRKSVNPEKIKTFKKRAKATIKSPLYLKALAIESTDPRVQALQYFIAGGRIHRQAFEKLFGGNKVSGRKSVSDEIKAHFQLQGRNGARSIDQLGHNLWDEADEQTQEKYDSQDFSNAVESVLLDHNSRTSMAEELAKYEEKGDEDWQNYYDQAHEGLEEDEQNQVDKAISILEGLSDEEIQQILDTEEAALADSEFLEQLSNQYDNPVSKEQAEKDKKLAEIEKDKQDKINKATKPEIQPEEQTKIEADLALTSEANRQQLDDIKQKLYSLRELVKCLWQ